MRRLFVLHRWIGWLLGSFLMISAATGIALQWMQPWPHAREAAPPAAQLASAVDSGLEELAQLHPPLRMTYIDLPRAASETIEVHLLPRDKSGAESWASLDPTTGAVRNVRVDGADPHSWIFNLHERLLLGEAGSWLVGGIAATVLVSLGIAIRLWFRVRRFPPPTARRRWHRRIGIVMLLPFAMTLWTGFALSWPEAVRRPLTVIDGGRKLIVPESRGIDPESPRVSAGQALLLAAQAMPDAVPTRLYAPKGGNFRLRLRSDEWHPNGLNSVYVAELGGRIAQVVTWRQLPLSAIYANWVYPLHIGMWPGSANRAASVALRALWTCIALSLAWMVVSGLPRRRRKAMST